MPPGLPVDSDEHDTGGAWKSMAVIVQHGVGADFGTVSLYIVLLLP